MLVAGTEYEALKLFGGIETTRQVTSGSKTEDFQMCILAKRGTDPGEAAPLIRSVQFVRVRSHCLQSRTILETESSETAIEAPTS